MTLEKMKEARKLERAIKKNRKAVKELIEMRTDSADSDGYNFVWLGGFPQVEVTWSTVRCMMDTAITQLSAEANEKERQLGDL